MRPGARRGGGDVCASQKAGKMPPPNQEVDMRHALNDGKLHWEEAQKFGISADEFRTADTNDDGYIDKSELFQVCDELA